MELSQLSEDDILFCSDVLFRKQPGLLSITSTRLIFSPNTTNSTQSDTFTLDLLSIKKFMVSAPNSPVHLLKIITDESDPKCIFIFQFQGDDAREQQISCKDLLSELLSCLKNSTTTTISMKTRKFLEGRSSQGSDDSVEKRTKKKTKKQHIQIVDDENQNSTSKSSLNIFTQREKRNQLLRVDPTLKELYKELVLSGIVSEEEFWKVHEMSTENLKSTTTSTSSTPQQQQQQQQQQQHQHQHQHQQQQQGLSSSLVNNFQSFFSSETSSNIFNSSLIKPIKENDDVLHFKLTAATIHQIFVEHPAVRIAYKRLVPEKMSENEFWTKYLQSQYLKLRQQTTITTSTKSSSSDLNKTKRKDKNETQDVDESNTVNENTTQSSEKKTTVDGEDLFIEKNFDESLELKEKIKELDPTFTLIKEEQEEDESSVVLQRDRRGKRKREVNATTAALIKKMNRHGALILDSFQDNQTLPDIQLSKMSNILTGVNSQSNISLNNNNNNNNNNERNENSMNENITDEEAMRAQRYRQVIQEKVTLKDLQDNNNNNNNNNNNSENVVCNVDSSSSVSSLFDLSESPTSQSHHDVESTHLKGNFKQQIHVSEDLKQLNLLKDEIKQWDPSNIKIDISMDLAGKITQELFPITNSSNTRVKLSEDILKQLISMYTTSNELLRHFWSSYSQMKTNREARQKTKRLRDVIEKFVEKLKTFEQKYNGPYKEQCTSLVSNMLPSLLRVLQEELK